MDQAVATMVPTSPRQQVHEVPSVLSSADSLRSALHSPGMKFCLKEFFNHDKATLLMNSGPGLMSDDHRKKLRCPNRRNHPQ